MDRRYKLAGANLVAWNEDYSKAYFIQHRYLCEVDIKNQSVQMLCDIPYDKDTGYLLCSNLICVGDEIFFAPAYGNKIYIYNTGNKKLSDVIFELGEYDEKVFETSPAFLFMLKVKNKLFFLGYRALQIVCLDILTREISYIEDWKQEFCKRNESSRLEWGRLGDGCAICGQKMYIAVSCLPEILEIDLETKEPRLIHTDVSTHGFNSIGKIDDNRIILIGHGEPSNIIVVWDVNKEEVITITKVEELNDRLHNTLNTPIVCGQRLIVPPYENDSKLHFYEIDKNDYSIKVIDPYPENDATHHPDKDILRSRAIGCAAVDENTIIFITGSDMRWHIYNIEENSSSDFFFEFDEEERIIENEKKEIFYAAKAGEAVSEQLLSLDSFIRNVCDDN